jgi:creatinine amidohydrolase
MTEELLRARLAELPRCLRETARLEPRIAKVASFVVTGIGASEAPARYTARLLRDARGARASFAPLSAFASGAPAADALVVFSQGLSPNARLALARAESYRHATLFTSLRDDADGAIPRFRERGGEVVVLPPAREDGTLVRVVGPSCAMLAAALACGAARREEAGALAEAVGDAPRRAGDVEGAVLARRVAFVTAGGHGELCEAARNAWLEGLCAPEPPSWDVLSVAHGPFQEFFESEIVLVALEREGDGGELFERLASMLVPGRHRLLRLRSSLPAALAAIDHVALAVELLCRALRARPRDLRAWPGCGRDGPLYGVGGTAE